MSDRYVADVLDEACRSILDRRRRGEQPPTEMLVNPIVYESVLHAKSDDLARGNPLLLLGLDLVSAEDVSPSKAELR